MSPKALGGAAARNHVSVNWASKTILPIATILLMECGEGETPVYLNQRVKVAPGGRYELVEQTGVYKSSDEFMSQLLIRGRPPLDTTSRRVAWSSADPGGTLTFTARWLDDSTVALEYMSIYTKMWPPPLGVRLLSSRVPYPYEAERPSAAERRGAKAAQRIP